MEQKRIVIIGSANTDMVVKSSHLPAPGETVLGGNFFMNPGGKGANQAVAAAKLDGDVVFVANLGNDIFGRLAVEGYKKHGIDTSYVNHEDNTPSGVALIMVDDQGENSISVALGANETLHRRAIDEAEEELKSANFILIQLEIPLPIVEYVIKKAKAFDTPVVLNPAPAQNLSDEMLSTIHIITPNETEAELLTGVKVQDQETARSAATILSEKGIEIVMITMGAQGVYVLSETIDELVPAYKVEAVDTTAAGDTFNGALLVGLAQDMSILDAIDFANQAAAYSVTKLGAQSSAPTRKDLNKFTNNL
jgi:ribokinase